LSAIKAFKEESNVIDNFKITLKKEIPISAGFGGGSSNAGTILKTINKIYDNVLSISTIEKICTKIGADCSFFLNPKPCITTGIGDICHEISDKFQSSLAQYKMFIFKPHFGINTSAAYKDLRDNFQKLYISKQSANEKMENLIEAVIHGDEKLPLYNTFYNMLSLRNNNFIKLKTSMDYIHSNVMLTGSGSGFFGICKSSRVLKYSKSVAKLIFGSDIFWREVSVL
jgi:4-diphosphocytidyl-2-C-methyl-D-erythritol kinase